MTVLARRIASIPVRLASDTWLRVVGLVAPTNAAAREELLGVTGIASSLITREAMKDSPIIVAGDGPRVRFYCVYGQAAIEEVGVNEASLPTSPAESGTWTMSLPCPADDLAWVQASLAQRSSHVTARDQAETSLPEPEDQARAAQVAIDLDSFYRP